MNQDLLAPELCAVDDETLAETMKDVEVGTTMNWDGPITIITGLRHTDKGSPGQPVVILKGENGAMHIIAVPGECYVS